MDTKNTANLEDLWSHHNAMWRDPAQAISLWENAEKINSKILRYRTDGAWWEVLDDLEITLLVTREYEHLLVALSVGSKGPEVSYLPLPHPSGLAVDQKQCRVFVSSTRNPNQIFELRPTNGALIRRDVKSTMDYRRPLVPVRSFFYPGCLYLHDMAFIDGELFGTAVGQNAVVQFHQDGRYELVWWPRCVETQDGPVFNQNHLQLNSIAAGPMISSSYFSASAEKISARRPGHKNFPVKNRGVIFSGVTREPVCRGLTRPHSARLRGSRIWVNNSGYGQLGFVKNSAFEVLTELPGWTRGLFIMKNTAFVGISHVIPRFEQYAPGLNAEKTLCGVCAVEVGSGTVIGRIIWPYGNQVFAVDSVSRRFSLGLPFTSRARSRRHSAFFFSYKTE